jgi:hypothetical protein
VTHSRAEKIISKIRLYLERKKRRLFRLRLVPPVVPVSRMIFSPTSTPPFLRAFLAKKPNGRRAASAITGDQSPVLEA